VDSVPTLVVGYGNMGTKHARVLRELGGSAAVWGVVDPSAERRERARRDNNDCRVFATIGEALGTGARPACATIAAPTPLHFELAQALLVARVPTLVEKPIASSAAQGDALIEIARANDTLLTVGHVERFNPAAVVARKIIAERVIGDLLQISFRRVGGSPTDAAATHLDVLADLAVHDYDLSTFVAGGTLDVVKALGHAENGRFDSVLVLAQLSTGASVQMQVNWRTPVKIRRVELTGTSGYVDINLITQQVVLYRQNPLFAQTTINPDSYSYYDNYLLSFASPDRVELGIERREPLQEELAAFWRAVALREPSLMSPADAVTAVRLTEKTRALLERR
jgi:UDP-N-acetylglucosamine 3-dehydrogenase